MFSCLNAIRYLQPLVASSPPLCSQEHSLYPFSSHNMSHPIQFVLPLRILFPFTVIKIFPSFTLSIHYSRHSSTYPHFKSFSPAPASSSSSSSSSCFASIQQYAPHSSSSFVDSHYCKIVSSFYFVTSILALISTSHLKFSVVYNFQISEMFNLYFLIVCHFLTVINSHNFFFVAFIFAPILSYLLPVSL